MTHAAGLVVAYRGLRSGVTPDELAEQAGSVQIVDVRWPNEWDAGRIEAAVHIPADELEDRTDELDRDRPVVTVCRSGNRSADAAALLVQEGFTAESLDGGMEAWAAAGLPVVDAGGRPGKVVEPEPPPDDRPEHLRRLEKAFLRTLFEVEEHFGDRQPTDDELRAFLRNRLVEQGRSAHEADALMASLDEP